MTMEHHAQDPHEILRELCALSTTGSLDVAEQVELGAHLKVCAGCRELQAQYQAIAGEGMPFLASTFAEEQDTAPWKNDRTRERLRAAVESLPRLEPARKQVPRWRHSNHIPPWFKAAAAACLLLSVGAGSYWLGIRREASTQAAYLAIVKQLELASAQNKSISRALAAQSDRESELRLKNSQAAQEVEQLRERLDGLDQQSRGLAAGASEKDRRLIVLGQERDGLAERLQKAEHALEDSQSQLGQQRALSQDRDALAVRLRNEEEHYQTAQADLAKFRDQANSEGDPALRAQIRALSAQLDQERENLARNEQFLASDRDIRELMGARQLYIADVFDVSSDGSTRKPYGRVFYTKGKSLIFYAFDLDRQPGFRNASTFQVWGQKEAAQGESRQALNLGILYMDSETNRRWVLRSDDPKQLAEIDAVFVTVEPRGGSRKPTSKPFLYALLRKQANHP